MRLPGLPGRRTPSNPAGQVRSAPVQVRT